MSMLGWYQVKMFIEHASGISMDALHILVGFFLFMLAARVMRTGIASSRPWLALLVLELANEAYDLHVELWPNLARQLGEGARDIMLTMAVPTLLFMTARWRPKWLVTSGAGPERLAGD